MSPSETINADSRGRSHGSSAGRHKGIDTPWAKVLIGRETSVPTLPTLYPVSEVLARTKAADKQAALTGVTTTFSPEHISNYRLLALGNIDPTQITRRLPKSRKLSRYRLSETNGYPGIYKHGAAYTPGNRFDNATTRLEDRTIAAKHHPPRDSGKDILLICAISPLDVGAERGLLHHCVGDLPKPQTAVVAYLKAQGWNCGRRGIPLNPLSLLVAWVAVRKQQSPIARDKTLLALRNKSAARPSETTQRYDTIWSTLIGDDTASTAHVVGVCEKHPTSNFWADRDGQQTAQLSQEPIWSSVVDDYERELGRAAVVQEARIHKVAYCVLATVGNDWPRTGPPTYLFGLKSSSVPVLSAKYRVSPRYIAPLDQWTVDYSARQRCAVRTCLQHPSPLYFEDLGSLGVTSAWRRVDSSWEDRSEDVRNGANINPGPDPQSGMNRARKWPVHDEIPSLVGPRHIVGDGPTSAEFSQVPRIRRTHSEPFLPHLLVRSVALTISADGTQFSRYVPKKDASAEFTEFVKSHQKNHRTMDINITTTCKKLTLTWRHNQLGHPSSTEKISGSDSTSEEFGEKLETIVLSPCSSRWDTCASPIAKQQMPVILNCVTDLEDGMLELDRPSPYSTAYPGRQDYKAHIALAIHPLTKNL
ncbi:uncharacterized protein CLUP02_06901 [Colletotrichum lupini]|uniref:Uncharacterized protein n=1 Tax=Colletotrichum lupini TaxID=145971 RepID=A0A9Q8SQW4_9PEZI|nr:uncharacterized protein CLUP02_06901 [Colletotrichum lupini]UQC81415.1 hypothetical protein CLUP02_06901 [Colletotrichum lupini]